MKIIQSIWFSSPHDIKGRWVNEKIALISMALSYHLLRKFYNQIELYTDAVGYNILIEKLGLDFNDVKLCLESPSLKADFGISFDEYWVLNKMYVYSLQNKPFIHVDNDVFIFKPFDENLLTSPLVAQNEEMNLVYYTDSLTGVQKYFNYIPDFLQNANSNICSAVNAGIVGGTEYTLYKNLYVEVIKLLEKNIQNLQYLNVDYFNIFLEQYLLKRYADFFNRPFNYVIKEMICPGDRYNVYKLHEAPDISPYIHLMNYKNNPTICEVVAKTLYWENRELYDKCIHVSKDFEKDGFSPSLHSIKFTDKIATENSLENFFYRTINIAKHLLSNIYLDLSNLNSLLHSIQDTTMYLPPEGYQILTDIFFFECQRYEFANSLNTHSIEDIYANVALAKNKIRDKNFYECNLSLSPHVKVIKTKWSWVQKNEFSKVKDPKVYTVNIGKAPAQYTSIIYYYPEQHKLKEQQLDNTNHLIIELACMKYPVADILFLMKEILSTNIPMQDIDKFLESRIRYFIHQGALYIHSPTL